MTKISYVGYRFPPAIIQQAIWLYLRFTLSFRDVEDLLAERGIVVSYETVRRWVNHFGPMIAADLRKRRPKPHSICWGGRVRRETGRRYEVKVLCGEGIANHTAPESCAATREGRSEALTGDSVGQPLSGENQLRSADAFRPAEGNTAYVAIARHRSAPRRRRHWHALTPPAREPGYLWTVLAEFCRDRAGKAGGRSRR